MLDQLGQQPAGATTALAPTAAATNASAPAVVDQPSPVAPLVAPATPLSAAQTLQATPTTSPPTSQSTIATPGASAKTADKKPKSDTPIETASLQPVTNSEAIPPIPVPEPTNPPAPTTISNATLHPAVSSIAESATPPPASKASLATDPPPRAAMPTGSRMADQEAVATQTGLSVANDRNDSGSSPEVQAEPQTPTAAVNHAAQAPAALPIPVATPQLASTALPAAPITSIAPARAEASALGRTSQPDGAPQLSSPPSGLATSPGPLAAVALPDIQTPAPIPSPASAAVAAGPISSTQPAQPRSAPPSPAAQVAQAITEPVKVFLTSPAQAGPSTPHVTTIQITPAELGRVEVRIERTGDGPAKIQLIAERSDTLSRLVHDQSHLQQALDHAGLSQSSRTIEFSLAPANTDAGALSPNLYGNNASGDGSPSNGSQRQNSTYYNQTLNEPDENTLGSATPTRILRTGIDITA